MPVGTGGPNRGTPVNQACSDNSDTPHRAQIQLPNNLQPCDLFVYILWESPGCIKKPCLHPVRQDATGVFPQKPDAFPQVFDPVADGAMEEPELVGGQWHAKGWACWHGVASPVGVLIYVGQCSPFHAPLPWPNKHTPCLCCCSGPPPQHKGAHVLLVLAAAP